MDVDTFYDAPKYDDADETGATEGRTNNRVVLPTNGESSSSPTLPEVNIGSEFWHSNVPSVSFESIVRHLHYAPQMAPKWCGTVCKSLMSWADTIKCSGFQDTLTK